MSAAGGTSSASPGAAPIGASSTPERVRALLWEGVEAPWKIYALVDGARDPRLRRAVVESGLPHACLYAGRIAPELAAAAPHLVELAPDAPLTTELLEGWGRAWGVWLVATGPLETLRRHFKKLLRVEDLRGRRFLFRFYDPRVLGAYLPTCTAGELRVVFGPVGMFALEAEHGAALVRFHREADGLRQRASRLAPGASDVRGA